MPTTAWMTRRRPAKPTPNPPDGLEQPEAFDALEAEPTPWYRKPPLLIAWLVFVAILIALIIYGITELLHGGPGTSPTPSTSSTSTTTTTTTTTHADHHHDADHQQCGRGAGTAADAAAHAPAGPAGADASASSATAAVGDHDSGGAHGDHGPARPALTPSAAMVRTTGGIGSGVRA